MEYLPTKLADLVRVDVGKYISTMEHMDTSEGHWSQRFSHGDLMRPEPPKAGEWSQVLTGSSPPVNVNQKLGRIIVFHWRSHYFDYTIAMLDCQKVVSWNLNSAYVI